MILSNNKVNAAIDAYAAVRSEENRSNLLRAAWNSSYGGDSEIQLNVFRGFLLVNLMDWAVFFLDSRESDNLVEE